MFLGSQEHQFLVGSLEQINPIQENLKNLQTFLEQVLIIWSQVKTKGYQSMHLMAQIIYGCLLYLGQTYWTLNIILILFSLFNAFM